MGKDKELIVSRVSCCVKGLSLSPFYISHFDDFFITGDDIPDHFRAVSPKAKLAVTWTSKRSLNEESLKSLFFHITKEAFMNYYEEPAKKLSVREFDVLVAGGGTAGVVAAIAAARQGVKTVLIETKGYLGGTAE